MHILFHRQLIWVKAALPFFLTTMVVTTAHADQYADVDALITAGNLSAALLKADQFLSSKPHDPKMRFLKGVIQTDKGNPASAISIFTQLTKDYPELPEPHNNLAVLYAGQSQFEKAKTSLEMAIRTNPSYATAHENLGSLYTRMANEAYSKALQLGGRKLGTPPKLALIHNQFRPESYVETKQEVITQKPQSLSGALVRQPAVVGKISPASAPAISLPVMPAPSRAESTPKQATSSTQDKEVENAVRDWAAAWAAKDMSGYLGSYSKDFATPNGQSRKSWEKDRHKRIFGKSSISVNLSEVIVSVNGSNAAVKFKQIYSADSLNMSSRKTLKLIKTGNRWLIVRELNG